jgi:hypothetical protein
MERPTLLMPYPAIYRSPAPEQPYRIILIAEKSSVREELSPVARAVEGQLFLPTGEISDTLVYDIAQAADQDGRPVVIFYFTDFDPGGNQMAVSVARKLQALKTLKFPDLDIRLYPAALTLEQVTRYNLPSTPLKPKEPRAAAWRARFGREQSELDAMLALHPGVLRQIAFDAVAPFWDRTLRERCQEAADQWLAETQARLEASPGYTAASDILRQAHALLSAAHEAYQRSLDEARDLLPEIDTEIEGPEPEVADEDAPEPLFDSDDDFVTATEKLRERKGYDD